MNVKVLRASDRVATPWKNGGGVTYQVASEPAGASLSDFDWRVSIAQITSSGPFSVFPDVDRILIILGGRLALSVDGQVGALATPRTAAQTFAGDVAAWAMPIGEPVEDLNLMYRRGRFQGEIKQLRAGRRHKLETGDDLILAIVIGGFECNFAKRTINLAHLDAIRLEARASAELTPRTPGSRAVTVRVRSLTPKSRSQA